MRLMGLVAVYQRPNTSKPAPENKVHPYLLGGLTIARVNQVWCADITYIPMARGFLYLVVIMDWVSRAVLGWRLSNTLGADFCVEALEEALAQYGKPEIFNTDQSLPSRKRGARRIDTSFSRPSFLRYCMNGGALRARRAGCLPVSPGCFPATAGSIRVRASCIGSFAWQPGVPASPSVSAFIRCGTASPRISWSRRLIFG